MSDEKQQADLFDELLTAGRNQVDARIGDLMEHAPKRLLSKVRALQ